MKNHNGQIRKNLGTGLNGNVASPNFNLVNIFRTLVDDKGCIVYIPATYENGTKHNKDSKVQTTPSGFPYEVEALKFEGNKERLNFSVKGLKEVWVDTDGELEQKKVWRSYNVIRDGKLVIDSISASLTEEAFTYLKGVELIKETKYNADYIYSINLKNIPLVSTNWARPNSLGLYGLMKEEIELTERAKVLRKIVKELKPADIESDSDIYIEDVDTIAETIKTYTADCVVYRLPKIKAKVDADAIKAEFNTYKLANAELKETKRILDYDRFLIRCIIFAIETSTAKGNYDWSDEADLPRSKGKKYRQVMVDIDGAQEILQRVTYQTEVAVG